MPRVQPELTPLLIRPRVAQRDLPSDENESSRSMHFPHLVLELLSILTYPCTLVLSSYLQRRRTREIESLGLSRGNYSHASFSVSDNLVQNQLTHILSSILDTRQPRLKATEMPIQKNRLRFWRLKIRQPRASKASKRKLKTRVSLYFLWTHVGKEMWTRFRASEDTLHILAHSYKLIILPFRLHKRRFTR